MQFELDVRAVPLPLGYPGMWCREQDSNPHCPAWNVNVNVTLNLCYINEPSARRWLGQT